MMIVVQKELHSPLKLIAVMDFIFISDVLGGWRNVLLILVFVAFSRYFLGGAQLLAPALLDYASLQCSV